MTLAFRLVLFLMLFAVGSAACGADALIGEECDESGVADGECETGGVCGKNAAGVLVCLKICNDRAECQVNQECRGVEGTTIKGCR